VSRLRRLQLQQRIFFLTTHVLPSSLPLTAPENDTILDAVGRARERRGFLLFAYAMMPNHLHLLLAPADHDTLSAVIREIKTAAAKRIQAARKKSGAFWQARSLDRIIRDRDEFEKTLLYIHLNPVTAGLTDHPSLWRWSSWFAWNPAGTPPLPVDRIEWPIME
jgi:REP element-mobilizing transposase RayT